MSLSTRGELSRLAIFHMRRSLSTCHIPHVATSIKLLPLNYFLTLQATILIFQNIEKNFLNVPLNQKRYRSFVRKYTIFPEVGVMSEMVKEKAIS